MFSKSRLVSMKCGNCLVHTSWRKLSCLNIHIIKKVRRVFQSNGITRNVSCHLLIVWWLFITQRYSDKSEDIDIITTLFPHLYPLNTALSHAYYAFLTDCKLNPGLQKPQQQCLSSASSSVDENKCTPNPISGLDLETHYSILWSSQPHVRGDTYCFTVKVENWQLCMLKTMRSQVKLMVQAEEGRTNQQMYRRRANYITLSCFY